MKHEDGLILFDLDGVILHSAPAIIASLRHALSECGIGTMPEQSLDWLIGPPLRVMFRTLLPDVSDGMVNDLCAAYRHHYDAHGAASTSLFPGISSALQQLSTVVPLRVATLKAQSSALSLIDEMGCAPYFHGIHGSLVPSEDQKLTVMQRAINEHRLVHPGARVVAMVGDRRQDIEASHQLGVPSVAVTWGYASPGELEDANPTHSAANCDQLLALLVGLVGG